MHVDVCPACRSRYETSPNHSTVARLKLLTMRERQLLPYILEGHSNTELADHAGIAKATAKIHRYHIYKKMNADSLMALMKLFDIGPRSPLLDNLLSTTAPKKT